VAEVRLSVVGGPDEGKEFDLSGSTIVGRDQSAGIVIDDPESSRRHASLSVEGSTVTVEDLGSTNGTFVNGQRISSPQTLSGADKLRIGTTTFEVHAQEEEQVQATRVGTALPDLDDIQVTAPRQIPDFAKDDQVTEQEPTAAGPPGGLSGAPGAPEPVPAAAPAATNVPPPSSAAPPPSGPPSAGPPPGSPPPPSSPPPYAPPNAGPGGAPPMYAGGPLAPAPSYVTPAGGQLSGWWRRVGAVLLDGIISIPFLVIGYVLIVAPILMKREGEHNGQTWGKQALGIRVVRNDGQPFSFGTALLRDFVIKGLFSVVSFVYLVDVLWPLWDPQNEALHDKLATTHVFRV
jgi:pSer/pThr/pTyr-binding forkhead associated (FHA) protein/uncharacterized RDD family membrane protein YckC